jgi:fatty-acyl-CoA synthase
MDFLMSNQRQKIENQLLTITREFLQQLSAERALQAISIDASLERDLGLDSLSKVELFHRIENTFSIQLPEKSMVEVESLNDLIKMIEKSKPGSSQFHIKNVSPVLENSTLDLSIAKTLVDVFHIYQEKEPKRPHLYLQNEKGFDKIIRYEDLINEATKIAAGLQKKGIQPGETIAIMLPTSEEFFYSFAGILLAGAIPVPIYPPFRPDRIEEYAKREARILQNAQVRILITFSEAKILSNILQTFIPSLKDVTTVKHLQTHPEFFSPVTIESHDSALIQYTSGSTGDPKGVLLTHENILSNIRGIEKGIPIKKNDVVVSWLPLYHDMGLMSWMASFYFGIPLTVLSPLTFLTRPERWLWAIHYHRATLSGGPNFAYELCVKKIDPKNIEGLDLSSWRFAFNGAEAIHPTTLKEFHKKFSKYGFKYETFAPVYGLAENTVGLTFAPETREPRIDKIQRKLFETENKAVAVNSDNKQETLEFVGCGEPMEDHDIRIVDDQNIELAEREVGNIQFCGPSAMQGYFNNPAATQKIYHDGWWDSGDLGYLVGKEIFITGRKKDVIIKAGRNLYPEEVENVVSQISSVRQGCVVAFGVSDKDTGTEKLIVVAETYEYSKDARQKIRAEIIEHMAISLGILPDAVILVAPRTISKTSSGKLQRSACKQEYLDGKLTQFRLPAKIQMAKLTLLGVGKKILSGLSYAGKLVYAFYIGLLLMIGMPILLLNLWIFTRHTAAKILQVWSKIFFILAFCPVKVQGRKYLKAHSHMIFVANHASYTDALILLSILPTDIIFIGKKELLNSKILKFVFKKLGYLTVDRMDFSKSIENKNKLEKAAQQGQSIVIFPEGTFSYATGLRPFKLGAFMIAAETKTPICPVSIQGSRSILRGANLLPKPGRINVTISKPIIPKNTQWDEMIRLHRLVRAEIAKHCGEPVIDVIVSGPM